MKERICFLPLVDNFPIQTFISIFPNCHSNRHDIFLVKPPEKTLDSSWSFHKLEKCFSPLCPIKKWLQTRCTNNKITLNAIQTGKIKPLTVGALLMNIVMGTAFPGKPMIKILIQALKLLIKGAKYKKIFVFNTHKTNLTKRV